MKILQVKNLDFKYKAGQIFVSIFKSFSLDINKGDFIAIKGPSGSGKSTLLYILAGLLKGQSGTVRFNNQDISKLSDLKLSFLRNKDIGFVFQQFHLLPKATVLENILLPTLYPIEEKKCLRKSRERAIALAQELGIGDRLDHFPNQLSGGQQQRVGIARALINDPQVLLADEPTGNLDSLATNQIIKIFKTLHAKGKTIVLITHEEEIAQVAAKTYLFKDGKIVDKKVQHTLKDSTETKIGHPPKFKIETNPIAKFSKIIPLVLNNTFRNKARSILTMLGITVGVAAVCSMITLGNFTKEKILTSYADLGVNTLLFRGYPSWTIKATDEFPMKYSHFDWNNELLPLKTIFPQIQYISPNMRHWDPAVTYGGRTVDRDPKLMGISEDGLTILGRKLLAGKGLSPFHIDRKYFVCVIGYEIGKRLFSNTSPVGKVIHVSLNQSTFACKVLGVLESKTSNKEWAKPNYQIFVPFPVFQIVSDNWWQTQIQEASIQVRPGTDVEKIGQAIRTFFERKYGKSGRFRVSSDSILVAQMKKFLNLFSILLAAIALVSLVVGGMGIANMMLVSVSERLKEIGVRKSVGATHSSIRSQFLMESLILCSVAGLLGIIVGIVGYQGAIYGASKLIPKLQFEWVFEPWAIALSLIAIVLVGILSGLAPAIKAERLQVIDALRSE